MNVELWKRTIVARLFRAGIVTIFAIAVWLTTGGVQLAAAESVLDEVKARGTLRVAGVVYRPLIMRRPSGEYYGADPEALGLLADHLGVELEFVNAGWDTAVAGIATGKWDLVPAICVTPKRMEVVDFTETYLMLGGVVVVLADNDKINSVEDANDAGIIMANVEGGWGQQIAEKAFPNATHKEFPGADDAQIAMELLSGRADATIFDTPVTIALIRAQYGDVFKFFPSATEPLDVIPCPVAYALKKGDTKFNNALSAFIKEKNESGEMKALFMKYMTPDFIHGTDQ